MMDKFEFNSGDDDLPLLFEPAVSSNKKKGILLVASGAIATIFVVIVVSVGVSSGVHRKTTSDRTQQTTGHWHVESVHRLTDSLTVTTSKSNKTGLTVVVANTESPVVNGFFCLATEAENDWGLPHTLEHLIFMGSRHYPYKDVLDLLGNRCLADRTNAWTATDHTCYTVSTAGSGGFIRILPIYMNHILNPTLKDGDFLTEVHRVNPEGQDVGVVYSEMQAAEQDSDTILTMKLLKLLFPDPSGYNKQTGGRLKDLREFTTNKEVKKFHKKFYRPENLVLTITGEVDLDKVQNALAVTEDRWVKEKGKKQIKFTRPWQATLNDVNSTEIEMEFPADDESVGSIYMGWRWPNYLAEITKQLSAQDILLTYLTQPHQGPLDLAIVNILEPLAESISADIDYYKKPITTINMKSVPTEKCRQAIQAMDDVLHDILQGGKKGFEKNHIKTLHTIIDQQQLKTANDNDNDPSSSVPSATLLNQLYGEKSEDFLNLYKMETDYGNLKNEPASFWLDIINNTLIQMPRVVVIGKPSSNLQQKMEKDNYDRIQERNKTLDREKLKKEEDNAIHNQKTPGTDVLDKIPLASVKDIPFKNIEAFKSSQSFPFTIHIDNIHSSFVQMIVLMNSENLTEREKLLLPTLLNLWEASPQNKNGTIITKEKVTQEHNKLLINFDTSFGIYGEFTESVTFSARADHTNFEDAIEDIKNTLLFADIDLHDLESSVRQSLSSIPDLYMDAETVQTTVKNYLAYQNSTNIYLKTLIQQEPFLKNLLKSDINGTKIELKNIMKKLTKENNCFIYLAMNKENLNSNILSNLENIFNLGKNYEENVEKDSTLNKQHPGMIIEKNVNESEMKRMSLKNKERFNIVNEYKLKRLDNFHIAVGIPGTRSCFLTQSIMYNNTNWNDLEVAHLNVLFEYISSRMYETIRGRGLTYSIDMYFSIAKGQISLEIGKSSQMVKTIKEVKKLLNTYTSKNTTVWKQTLLDSAKGSVIYRKTNNEATVEDLEFQSALSYMRNVDSTWNRNNIKHIAKVELEHIIKAAKKFFPKFFSQQANTVMVCNKGDLDTIVTKLKNEGLYLEKFNTVEEFVKKFQKD